MSNPALPFIKKKKKKVTPVEEIREEEFYDGPEIGYTQDVVACVVDYGTFICLAEKLAETYKKVYYYTPTSQEFYSITDLVKAEGLSKVERVFDIFDKDFLDKVDLFIFPDIGYGGLQKHLRDIGKAVWGSMGADELEIIRTEFMKTLERLKLPTIHTEHIKGVTALREHLDTVKNKWIKIDKYRGNMETWHHIDMEHSFQELDRLDLEFGGLKDTVQFVVQDYIKTDIETGYDGWSIDGKFPNQSFQGYEKKDELYLGSVLTHDELSDQIKLVNEAMSPILEEYSYRNFFATEVRIKDDVPYFIDPTLRMPGMTGEQLTETCSNLAEVIWYGAQGVLIEPEFKYRFAASATMHFKTKNAKEGWMLIKVPEKIKQWVKLSHHAFLDGMYHFPPKDNGELGLVIGVGNSIEEAVKMVVKNVKVLKDEPVYCELEGYCELVDDIKEAEKYGIHFGDSKLPDLKDIVS